ncbi:MAG: ATP-binding protein [Kiritimatiellae bacterium]|nr:ATP-binding protein [Kiritimatiellia bacterium]
MIGRSKERRMLEEARDSEYSEFVAVYGRRRVGKTFLVRETFDYTFTFQHSGLANSGMKRQLKAFAGALRESGLDIGAVPGDWMDAFDALKDVIRRSDAPKKVVFIDEMPWMDTPKSGFVSALENFWNGWASARKDVLLIVCGSATSWIIKKILRNRGGLHNRVTVEIPLSPFTLRECEQYAESRGLGMSRRQIVECYMALGGIPYYWKQLVRGLSPAQNVEALFLARNGRLRMEYSELYSSLFKNPEPYERIVSELGRRGAGLTREEIASGVGIAESGTLTRYLEELEQCGFVRKYSVLGKKNKGAVFQLIDSYTLFHFKVLVAAEGKGEHFLASSVDSRFVGTWEGLAFERVCLMHVDEIKKALQIGGVVCEVLPWRSSGDEHVQIDMLINRNDGVINLCEMKFSREPYELTADELARMQRRRRVFKDETGTRKAVHLTLVVSPELKKNAYAYDIQSTVTIDDLFRE